MTKSGIDNAPCSEPFAVVGSYPVIFRGVGGPAWPMSGSRLKTTIIGPCFGSEIQTTDPAVANGVKSSLRNGNLGLFAQAVTAS